MPKSSLALVALLSFCALPAAASDSFSEKCPDIPTCAKVVGEMLGQKYIFDTDVKGKVQSTNLELTRQNAELLFTEMLNLNGYSRVPLGEANAFQILRQRDARDLTIPSVTADQRMAPNLPENWDMYTMKYKATHPESVEHIARMSRSFMPANSRIIPDELSGMLLVTDSAMNLKKLYALLTDLDQKPTAELRKKWDEDQKEYRAEARERRMHPPLLPPGAQAPGSEAQKGK